MTDKIQSTTAAQRPVMWRVKNDFGYWHLTEQEALANTWRDTEKLDVQALYLAARPPAAPVATDDVTAALNARQAAINEMMAAPVETGRNRDPIYAPDGRTWYQTALDEASKRGVNEIRIHELEEQLAARPSSSAATEDVKPVAWIGRYKNAGVNFGTMAKTEDGAQSRIMMTGVAGEGWEVIPLYTDLPQTAPVSAASDPVVGPNVQTVDFDDNSGADPAWHKIQDQIDEWAQQTLPPDHALAIMSWSDRLAQHLTVTPTELRGAEHHARRETQAAILSALLREARQYVSDAGSDEDGETQSHSTALLSAIDTALSLSRQTDGE